MKKTRLIAAACALALVLSSCATTNKPRKSVPTLAPDDFSAKEPEPLGYESILGSALDAYASSSQTGWSKSELNRDRLNYTSELDDGEYDFVFNRCGVELSCSVDALSGEIYDLSSRTIPEKPYVPLSPDTAEEEAAASALGYFGIDESEVDGLKVEYDAEEEPEYRHYYVGFTYDGVEYKCEISSNGEFYTSNVDIGSYGAESLAFDDFIEHIDSIPVRDDLTAFIISGEIYDMISGRSDENGVRSYYVSFKVGGYKFDYLISATGEVLDYSIELVDGWNGAIAGAFYSEPERLSEHDALKIALEDACVSPEDMKSPEVVYNDNYGYGFYSISFGDGERSYSYEVDAYSGKVIGSDK